MINLESNLKYKYILFDLDGTVTDSQEGIENSFIYALKKYGIEISDRSRLKQFIGPPLLSSFLSFPEIGTEKAEEAVEVYREYYKDKGIFENRVYPQIVELFEALEKSGVEIYLATSKATIYAVQILKYFNLMKYFSGAEGSNYDGTRTNKVEIIDYIIKQYKITPAQEILMVGDRKHDIDGAHEAGIKAAGALWGYGTKDEFEKAGADYFLANPLDILNII